MRQLVLLLLALSLPCVITNEDLPEHTASTAPSAPDFQVSGTTNLDLGGNQRQQLAEQFKSRIRDQNQTIAELQNQISAGERFRPLRRRELRLPLRAVERTPAAEAARSGHHESPTGGGAAPSGPAARSR